jgi:hypothetical protein
MNSAQIKTFQALHSEALVISKRLHQNEVLLIEILQKIDHLKAYRFFGFKSLIQYATIALKLSKDRAYNFITVSRKASQVDKLQKALACGGITLSKAKRISSVINEGNADHWLNLSNSLSQRSLERAVAKANPRAVVEEGTRFISENLLELKAVISLDTEKLLSRVKDLLAQSKGKDVSMDEVLKEIAKDFVTRRDPIARAQRVIQRKLRLQAQKSSPNEKLESQSPCSSQRRVRGLFHRTPVPARLKHEIYLRDRGECQAIDATGAQL